VNVPTESVLLQRWCGPYGGVPPYDQVDIEQLYPAMCEAIARFRGQVEEIASCSSAPTFANTVEALEDAGRVLWRVRTVYWVWSSTMSTPELREIEQRVEPLLAAWTDELLGHDELFARVEAVANSSELAELGEEAGRLVWRTHQSFVRGGARLEGTHKARLGTINLRLATLYTQFTQNLLADEETCVVLDADEVQGLPQAVRDALAQAASERGHEGAWAVVNTRSVVEPVLTSTVHRGARERVWRAFVSRGDRGGAHDNNALIVEIMSLRGERARLLGYKTHAHWRLDDAMARDPEQTQWLMGELWTPAVARVRQEVEDQQTLAASLGHEGPIKPWDYRFYQERVRKARYDLAAEDLKPYLELESLREGMFWMAGQAYGLSFRLAPEVPVCHPDVRVWSVHGGEEELVGLWTFDPYARSGKRSGAWMSAYRMQERFRGVVAPIISNNENFVKGVGDAPTLLSWSDATTLLHEFGHALHGLLSSVSYPSLAGTSVSRDYVEFPSQLHEHWLSAPEFLDRFARHVETGEAMPAAMRARLQAAATFNQGFATVEFLASARMDMALHLAEVPPTDPRAFEQETLDGFGMPSEIVMRHRLPQFGHLFAGDGYSAAYYSYLWADALTADAAEAFKEAGSMLHEETSKRLLRCVLSVGDTVDAAEGFRAFRGRDVQVAALLRDRGFPVTDG
jgi:peptidyl-dipeptidase Dcp